MDPQHLVALALQHGADEAGHRPGLAGQRVFVGRRRRTRAELLRLLGKKKSNATQKAAAFKSQASFANKTGRHRTQDFLIPAEVGSKRLVPKGRGQWKRWTCESVLRSAFASESMAARHVADQVDGGSAAHSILCKSYVANQILKGQQTGLERFIANHQPQEGRETIHFALTNCIFDETELEINLHEYGLGEWSILASHSQMTFRANQQTYDFDVIRLPVALPNKQATTMWPALCSGEGGLWPGLSLVPAKIRAVLVTCDAAPANLKLLGHLQPVLDPKTLLLPFLCLQHRTGNVIERATKLMGTLTGSYAVAKTLRSGAIVRRLTQNVKRVLTQTLQVTDQVPAGLEEEWAMGQVCSLKLLRLARGEPEDEKEDIVHEFTAFFAGPWRGLGPGVSRLSG